MIELQYDAGGRRCVEHLRPSGKQVSFDGIPTTEKPLPAIKPATLSLVVIRASTPAVVTIGSFPIELDGETPFLWTRTKGISSPFGEGPEDAPMTSTAEDPETTFTVLLAQ
jgi:hypothetical protein